MFKKIYFIPLLVMGTLLLAGCNGTDLSKREITHSGRMVSMEGLSHNWGDVNIQGGDMTHTFTLKNESETPLYLKGAETSCMCTTARYRLADDSISPKFGMHNNAENWVAKVKPGELFKVETWFDPLAHGPGGTGPIERVIYLNTSDPRGSVQLRLTGDVLSEDDFRKKHL